jgi:hypothetical protein
MTDSRPSPERRRRPSRQRGRGRGNGIRTCCGAAFPGGRTGDVASKILESRAHAFRTPGSSRILDAARVGERGAGLRGIVRVGSCRPGSSRGDLALGARLPTMFGFQKYVASGG